jgi:predicted membrane-bound mannosyltransferase
MLTSVSAYPSIPPEIVGWPVVAAVLPVVVITTLMACAALVAIFAGGERAKRADAVLTILLDALRALYRCRPSGRDTANNDRPALETGRATNWNRSAAASDPAVPTNATDEGGLWPDFRMRSRRSRTSITVATLLE